ncbi:MAG TPA: ADP-ribosylglycohydrolase family protein [Lachnospiraceae bacterium]|nr:ADP-ribosylglycohydrolase family protein [Lachnospiraceae bacterium]
MENILKDVRLEYVSRACHLDTELLQSAQEGKRVDDSLKKRAGEISARRGEEQAEADALFLCEELRRRPVEASFPYREPETPEEIMAMFPGSAPPVFTERQLYDRILGAWLGRAAGCLLGQPVESWDRERILGFLKASGNYPIAGYLSSDVDEDVRKRYDVKDEPGAYGNKKVSWVNNITCAPEDDDMNYTVMGLGILENYGKDFTPMDVAEYLTLNVPVFMTCTAERIAYKNILNGILPPRSASYGNPYREWLGAQIRVDAYAYVNPGNPRAAAAMAVRDASVTHTKNGIYGAAFCAALIAESAVCQNAREAIDRALAYVPGGSRLYEALTEFLKLCDSTGEPEEMIRWIHGRYDEKNLHDWCHVIPNDMIICLALLYGGEDFSRVIGLAVEAGFDTDCNGATAGSAFGMMYGTAAIPEKWTKPLNGKLMTRIGCLGRTEFTSLADRCVKLAGK